MELFLEKDISIKISKY